MSNILENLSIYEEIELIVPWKVIRKASEDMPSEVFAFVFQVVSYLHESFMMQVTLQYSIHYKKYMGK